MPARPGAPLLIAVDGFSGAGKTTLATEIAAAMTRRGSVQLFHLEDIYPGWDGLESGMTYYREQILRPLAGNRAARWQAWDWEAGRYGHWRTTEPADVVVFEGVGAAHREARALLDTAVWVEGEETVRRRCALARDGGTYAPHWERWAAQERRWAADDDAASAADLTVSLVGPQGNTATALAAVLACLPR
ncbi:MULTISPECIES: hypothetical protein [unclassified Arthrobacter]|uniref:hypothetical protein n=1 Tax=unclassified Arthrobacter TaxID=235627 RepID=UPI001E479CDE|nr:MULTISPECIES: hypothetical protein [unclassified Arthrobacter]MCC9144671.1 hypothetical protein [Arthrobacter sp. zg-Y919]MDK1275897.1 hypothetical protein [Arthrobacter sp. zg.Y919]MDM7990244.1 hypothetical protein [Arthrobacter sp. zg-Y877]WIB02747.1 hypothetical protein QNO10_12475 [Arthrobacter sp. zg-Y919]